MYVHTILWFAAFAAVSIASPATKPGSEADTASVAVKPVVDTLAQNSKIAETIESKPIVKEAADVKPVEGITDVKKIDETPKAVEAEAAAVVVAQSEAEVDLPQVRQQHLDPCEQGQGVCMSSLECSFQRGNNIGNCDGGGVCCHISKTCEKGKEVEITTNNTYFVEPNKVWEPEGSIHCGVRVRKLTPLGQHICQMRLDFVNFNTVGPDPSSGKCKYDMLTIEGSDSNTRVQNLCGLNDGQHVYVDVKHTDAIKLRMNVDFSKDPNRVRKWNIRITQLPCRSPRLAPPGCLQYFEEYSGTIKSFNYGPQGVNETSYPLGLRYSMCFKRGPDSCRVFLRKAGPFGLGEVSSDESEGETDSKCYSKKGTPDAPANSKAYLQIDNVKHCGKSFDDEYRTEDNGVNAFTFVSPDAEEIRKNGTEGQPQGFKFVYRLLACGAGL